MRFFIPTYFLGYFIICFVWRWISFYRQTGKNPIILGDSRTPHGYLGLWLKVVVILIGIEVITFIANPEIFQEGPLKNWALPDWAAYAGATLWIVSLIVSAMAQIQMGKSWRIGFNATEKTEIIKIGLYRRSRNPIYVGMIMTLLGLFLVLPNSLSLILFVLGYVLLQITVRLEEAHLLSLHGQPYREYLDAVPRWI